MRFRAANVKALFSILLLGAGMYCAQAQLIISNNLLSVNFNQASGQFFATNFASGRTFISQGSFNETSGPAAIVTVSNATFGVGQEIQFAHPDGNSDAIMLFSNVPFAFFQSTLTNGSSQTVISNHIHTLTALVDLDEPVGNLKAIGTGGLTTPSANPGSYAWLAVADPQSRNGVVGAWLTSDRGSGIVFGKVNGSLVQMDAQLDYGRLQFLPGQTNALEIFALGYFDDARVGLETWADEIAQVYNIHLPPQPDGLCTYPMNQNGGASSPAAVAQLTDFVKTNLEPFGFDMIQIDAGWQGGITSTNGSNHGPTRVFTEYTNAYSAGVKPTADYMATNGITPGIWFEPFAGTSDDPYFTNHEDWFVETTNGTPYWCEWGGNSLDMTYQPARNYVSNMVSNISQNWDYTYFKMDGFWTGTATPLEYVNSSYVDDHMGDAVFSNPAKPNIEAFRDGIKLVREAAGTNVFFDGCNIAQNMRSYSGSFGLLDAMRVGPDNSASWSGWQRSTQYGSRHYFLQGRVW
ncbi:MAG TPA: alpha-galactosidase, partial [Verrucomicrobiae bacterium]|nr:alpha-galactosidase [Verrucomicrobiae bacterium]